jgi:hypothetical protein
MISLPRALAWQPSQSNLLCDWSQPAGPSRAATHQKSDSTLGGTHVSDISPAKAPPSKQNFARLVAVVVYATERS